MKSTLFQERTDNTKTFKRSGKFPLAFFLLCLDNAKTPTYIHEQMIICLFVIQRKDYNGKQCIFAE